MSTAVVCVRFYEKYGVYNLGETAGFSYPEALALVEKLRGIADAMQHAATERDTPGQTIITKPTAKGAIVVESS